MRLFFSYVRDATASMAVAFSLFNFPAKRPTLFDDEEEEEENKGTHRRFIWLFKLEQTKSFEETLLIVSKHHNVHYIVSS